jgi:hypothetical protein
MGSYWALGSEGFVSFRAVAAAPIVLPHDVEHYPPLFVATLQRSQQLFSLHQVALHEPLLPGYSQAKLQQQSIETDLLAYTVSKHAEIIHPVG